MRILVLGHTGYLGAHVAERLRALPTVRVLRAGRAPGAGVRLDRPPAPPPPRGTGRAAAAPPPRGGGEP
ncbi:NAD(P)-dependent oxidoreductase, partial [Streptomyces sp. NPDC048551]